MKLIDWLKQPSTWSMIVMIAGWAGASLTVGLVETACNFIVAGMVLYNLLRQEGHI